MTKCVFYIPGINPDATDTKDLEQMLSKENISFVKLELWKDITELESKTLGSIHLEIDENLKSLKLKGFTRICIIGKSFGGCISLTYRNPIVSCMVLWAPAIGISEKSNVNEWSNSKISEIKELNDIKVSKEYLKDLTIPVLLIQGTDDNVVKPEDTEKLSVLIDNSSFEKINGADHSYKNNDHRKDVFEKTLNFIKEKL